jgi:hypothetical protein
VYNHKGKFEAQTPRGFVEAGNETTIGSFSNGALPPGFLAFPPCMTLSHPIPVMAAIAAARARRDFMIANPNADFGNEEQKTVLMAADADDSSDDDMPLSRYSSTANRLAMELDQSKLLLLLLLWCLWCRNCHNRRPWVRMTRVTQGRRSERPRRPQSDQSHVDVEILMVIPVGRHTHPSSRTRSSHSMCMALP